MIGAGPAGLSAAAEITASGGRCLVVEQGNGPSERDRDRPEDILSGVGGAGLFSDGKHSFFPAATGLWRLPDRARLVVAYERASEVLRRHGVEAPPFPAALPPPLASNEDPSWRFKAYPSVYASLEERLSCIRELYERCGDAPLTSARVLGARRVSGVGCRGFELTIEQRGRVFTVETPRLVVATGRLSPRWIRQWLEPLGGQWRFRRLEFGVRIETRASSPLFTALRGVDPKYSWADAGVELRTFCTCRDGEVVLGRVAELHAFSGRADGPRTGRSSVGLLVHTTDEGVARVVEPHLFASRKHPLRASLAGVLVAGGAHGGLVDTFGERGAALVATALERFVEHFPDLTDDDSATVYAPCIEGVGDYPVDDGDLLLAPDLWIAGDACGRFRGIVASMVSGRYVGAGVSAATG